MSRPLRLQLPGALYHVTSRGDRKMPVYVDDRDRVMWLAILAEVCARHNFVIHGFCQMTNHYHIVVETVDGNLARGMQQLNGVYSQYFNRRHGLVGHVFQGRYKAILVQQDVYLMAVARYVILNPVRAGLVRSPDEWPWSSYRYCVGASTAPTWLDVATTLLAFSPETAAAIDAYRRFVLAGIDAPSPLLQTRHQLILGEQPLPAAAPPRQPLSLRAVAKSQRRAVAMSLAEYQQQATSRDQAMSDAYHSTAYTMEQISAHFGVSAKTVSRAIKKHRAR
ncbi:REP element-mobilizing transposase RayT [Duganella sp. 1224]|uniref:transposase n=1 Tax=Duganella sp. 1224 TaxID=2587052 RepID=UPI0015C6B559|nr:transposase [Duganella sp. 1224]NYE60399.1 REP element-mobilizing transposase RayT [Duganella sp. 1224]